MRWKSIKEAFSDKRPKPKFVKKPNDLPPEEGDEEDADQEFVSKNEEGPPSGKKKPSFGKQFGKHEEPDGDEDGQDLDDDGDGRFPPKGNVDGKQPFDMRGNPPLKSNEFASDDEMDAQNRLDGFDDEEEREVPTERRTVLILNPREDDSDDTNKFKTDSQPKAPSQPGLIKKPDPRKQQTPPPDARDNPDLRTTTEPSFDDEDEEVPPDDKFKKNKKKKTLPMQEHLLARFLTNR